MALNILQSLAHFSLGRFFLWQFAHGEEIIIPPSDAIIIMKNHFP
jgi:hypothetical protein